MIVMNITTAWAARIGRPIISTKKGSSIKLISMLTP
jgi:hypothetical protein